MGRRRKGRKVEKRVIPRLPKVFECPNCGYKSLYIEIKRKENIANISCGSCGITATLNVPPIYEPVDVYGDFVDKFYKGEIPIKKEKISEEKFI